MILADGARIAFVEPLVDTLVYMGMKRERRKGRQLVGRGVYGCVCV